jgi:hypothetical protein
MSTLNAKIIPTYTKSGQWFPRKRKKVKLGDMQTVAISGLQELANLSEVKRYFASSLA